MSFHPTPRGEEGVPTKGSLDPDLRLGLGSRIKPLDSVAPHFWMFLAN